MQPRERVLVALSHREPDRVPIEFGTDGLSSIHLGGPYGYEAVCELVGLADPVAPAINPFLGSVTNIDERLMERFGSDLRAVWIGGYPLEQLPDGKLREPTWGFVLTPHGTASGATAPMRDATKISQIRSYSWPDTSDPVLIEGKAAEARAYRDAGYAVIAAAGNAFQVFSNYWFLRGFEAWLLDMYDRPAFYHALCEKIIEIDIACLETFLGAVGEFSDIVMFNDDLGSQHGPMISPDAYRRFCFPYQKQWLAAVRRLAPHALVLYHSCGAVRPFIRDFIELGIDVLNPVQPRAAGMEPRALKLDFGRDLSFLGGFDVQELLPFGTETDVRAGAVDLIEALGPGGGFVFSPSHQILPEVPPQNVVAMYDAALEFGRYPLGARG
jgi:uroporphyrinogen decarboxylase